MTTCARRAAFLIATLSVFRAKSSAAFRFVLCKYRWSSFDLFSEKKTKQSLTPQIAHWANEKCKCHFENNFVEQAHLYLLW